MGFKFLNALSCELTEDKIYFVNSDINMLYAMKLDSDEIELMIRIPEEDLFGKYLFGDVVKWEHKLFLIPLYAKKIWVYDLQKFDWNSIELPAEIGEIEEKFHGAILNQNLIYLFGHKWPGIATLDVRTYKIEMLMLPQNVQNLNYSKDGIFNWDYVLLDNSLYLPLMCKNEIIKLNLKDKKIEEFVVGDEKNKYVGLTYDGKYFWLAPRKGKYFVRWDGHKNIKEYVLPADYLIDKYYFGGAFCYGKWVCFTGFDGYSYLFDKYRMEYFKIIKEKIVWHRCKKDRIVLQKDNGKIKVISNAKEKNINLKYNISLYMKECEYPKMLIEENQIFKFFDFLEMVK